MSTAITRKTLFHYIPGNDTNSPQLSKSIPQKSISQMAEAEEIVSEAFKPPISVAGKLC